MNGLDYSFSRPPSPEWLVQNGYGFVCRYLSDFPSKNITASEYQGLRDAGVLMVLNWENSTNDFDGGGTNGWAYANRAMIQAQELGAWPCPIYFSKDEHTAPSAADNAFLSAAVQALGGSQYVGIYGSRTMVEWAINAGLAKYGWQNVWDSPPISPLAHIYQSSGGDLGWGSVDFDESLQDDFGQVGYVNPSQEEDSSVQEMTIEAAGQQHIVYLVPTSGGAGKLFYRMYDEKAGTETDPVEVSQTDLRLSAGLDLSVEHGPTGDIEVHVVAQRLTPPPTLAHFWATVPYVAGTTQWGEQGL